jgi:hypothetical protein
MQFVYGETKAIRLLDEANFWKHQEQEHTVVIREIVPDLEKRFVEDLKQWETAFLKTHSRVIQLTETMIRSGNYAPAYLNQVQTLISYSLEQSSRWIQFLFEILSLSPAVKKAPVAKTVIRHIIRESEYFSGIAQTICAD